MFEAADDFKFMRVVGFGAPEILVDEGEVFLDGGREVVVVFYEIAHAFPLEVLDLVDDDVDALVEVALLLALPAVEFPVELEHGLVALGVGPPDPVLDQFQNAVLDEDNRDILLADPVFAEGAEVGVDSLEGGLDGVAGLVVHADADDDLDAFEVEAPVFLALGHLAEVVDQPVGGLEVADLVFLGGIVVDDLGAVGGGDAGEVLAEGRAAVCHDQPFVEPGAAEYVHRLERVLHLLRHLLLLLLRPKKISRATLQIIQGA